MVGKQGRRSGDIGSDAFRRCTIRHNFPDGFNGFVCECFTHVAGEVKLNVRRLTICADRTRRRQGITPKVLNVLDMALVQYERIDQVVVIPMGLLA
ncbi:Uncharacterised protein [Mycobacterium tuberculosis]|uniref:Uncharacterized protein n=1 Tax=Mycobacterium tuberculosis TaxID=1773 RepID=A0A0U0SJZ8_MYCTX|nr:Uncharacterised protein [Mycobacterium tuberculosis]CFE57018.1 Uncharacterised protein [Mycobacterium tuberculosis]CFR65119.1 Uncharacterised protein [Mycobacterium tuberculosis]CFS29451.1 Uncharacterised protein [Mycobacterium tuberculosis]CNU84980.1 Uncharacterised protein [Mycobacterium tuberculosis]